MQKSTIAAHVPAYNHPDLFLRCISHLLWVDELVIADNSNNDSIKDVLPLIKHTNIKYFKCDEGDIRLRLIELKEQTDSEYILWVHTDEFYSEEAAKEIQSVLSDRQNLKDGYIIPSVSYLYFEPYGKGASQLRLFKKNEFYFDLKTIHEMPKVKGEVGYLFNSYTHYNSPTLSSQVPKVFLYALNDANILSDDQLRLKRQDTYTSFQIKKLFFIRLLRVIWRSRYLFFKKKVTFVDLWTRYLELLTLVANDAVPTEQMREREGMKY